MGTIIYCVLCNYFVLKQILAHGLIIKRVSNQIGGLYTDWTLRGLHGRLQYNLEIDFYCLSAVIPIIRVCFQMEESSPIEIHVSLTYTVQTEKLKIQIFAARNLPDIPGMSSKYR